MLEIINKNAPEPKPVADAAPHTFEARAETDELSIDQLDDVNGGLLIPLLFAAGFYYGYRHPLW